MNSDKFRKWMADGSLLWIHGKGMFHSYVTSVISWTTHFFCSWLWEEHPMVCRPSNLRIGKLIIVD